MARGGRSIISHIRSVHWITSKWETGSQFIKCQGFLAWLQQRTPQVKRFFMILPTGPGALVPNGMKTFHGKVFVRLWGSFPGGVEVCIMQFYSFIYTKVSLGSLRSWLEESISPNLPSVSSFKVYAKGWGREASRRDKWEGGDEGNEMDYEFENCQLSCIIQLGALAQWWATIQIFQLKWLYIQASKLTIK